MDFPVKSYEYCTGWPVHLWSTLSSIHNEVYPSSRGVTHSLTWARYNEDFLYSLGRLTNRPPDKRQSWPSDPIRVYFIHYCYHTYSARAITGHFRFADCQWKMRRKCSPIWDISVHDCAILVLHTRNYAAAASIGIGPITIPASYHTIPVRFMLVC